MTYRPPSDESLAAMDLAMIDRVAKERDRARDLFQEQETLIAILERENRKLTDSLNRFRNLTPGRKRLHSLGRIAAYLEYEADEVTLKAEARYDDPVSQSVARLEGLYAGAYREDAIFLHRLQWDFEQLREVVYPSDTPSHVWKRP